MASNTRTPANRDLTQQMDQEGQGDRKLHKKSKTQLIRMLQRHRTWEEEQKTKTRTMEEELQELKRLKEKAQRKKERAQQRTAFLNSQLDLIAERLNDKRSLTDEQKQFLKKGYRAYQNGQMQEEETPDTTHKSQRKKKKRKKGKSSHGEEGQEAGEAETVETQAPTAGSEDSGSEAEEILETAKLDPHLARRMLRRKLKRQKRGRDQGSSYELTRETQYKIWDGEGRGGSDITLFIDDFNYTAALNKVKGPRLLDVLITKALDGTAREIMMAWRQEQSRKGDEPSFDAGVQHLKHIYGTQESEDKANALVALTSLQCGPITKDPTHLAQFNARFGRLCGRAELDEDSAKGVYLSKLPKDLRTYLGDDVNKRGLSLEKLQAKAFTGAKGLFEGDIKLVSQQAPPATTPAKTGAPLIPKKRKVTWEDEPFNSVGMEEGDESAGGAGGATEGLAELVVNAVAQQLEPLLQRLQPRPDPVGTSKPTAAPVNKKPKKDRSHIKCWKEGCGKMGHFATDHNAAWFKKKFNDDGTPRVGGGGTKPASKDPNGKTA